LKAWLKTVPGLRGAINAGRRAARLIAELPGEIGFLWRCFAALRGIDRLIIAGGGQLGDYFGGPWGYPLGIFRWCALARTAGARVAFVSVGAEPIRSPISRWLLRRALALADYRSFRDEGSRLLMERIGVPGDQRVCPDLVHGLRLPAAAPPVRAGAGLTVGINPVPFFDARYWTERDDAVYHHYVSALADFASWLIRRGHRVLFFPTQVHADPPVIHDIELMMKRTAGGWNEDRVLQPLVTDFDSLSAALGMVDVAVASRFHGIIFSILLGTPVLALSYYRKIEDLMTDMGQGDFVLAIKDLDLDSLLRSFSQLEGRLDAVRRETTERRAQYQRALAQQYLELLGSRR
jgi:polysaccharide pyruvyl transferase WcaK-like protein